MTDFNHTPPTEPDLAPAPFWRRRPRVALTAGAAGLFVLLLAWLSWALPVGRALEPLESPTLVLVTADGKPFARRGSYNEAPVTLDELPQHVPGAFIAIEDRRFYRHAGLDLRGIARAMRNNARAGAMEEGGSTITQQLAKNAFLSNERTLRRKAQEAVIALYLEARLSKPEILSRYLSSVYFGDGVFGVRAAARHYFDKRPEDLSIGEAALLAGLVKAPSRLAPTENLRGARERARLVLASMVRDGVINEAQARRHRSPRVREGRDELPVGSYFADWVSPQAKAAFERAYGELLVRTTLDSRLQAQAERIIRRRLAGDGARLNVTQAALVAMRPDGSVVAMVGGRDYRASQFNRATQAERQPGSAFKLFVYWAALRRGRNAETRVLDAPVQVGDWSPQNYEERYAGGVVSYQQAFAGSSNVAAVRVAQEAGLADVIRAARDLGVRRPLPESPTISLGVAEMTLLELTSAYATVAAGHAPVTPVGLQNASRPRTRSLPARERREMLKLLEAVTTSGTGRAARLPVQTFGKTGTTQDYRDALFVGFAGDLIVGVWVGNDDNTPMREVAGGGLPAQIWREFMSGAGAARDRELGGRDRPVEPPEPPELGPEDVPLDDPFRPREAGPPLEPFDPGVPGPSPGEIPPPELGLPPPPPAPAEDGPEPEDVPEPAEGL